MRAVFHTKQQLELTWQNHSTTTWFAEIYILRKDSRLLFVRICYQWHVMGIALRWPVTP